MSETTEDVPLTKTKRYYEKTPARLAAIEKMVTARRKNQEIDRAQKLLHAENVLKKNGVEVPAKKEAPPKPELKKEVETISKEDQKKKLKELAGDDYESDAEIVVIKKKKPKKKIIIEESDSDEEPIIVKRKKEPKEVITKPSRVLQVNNNPPPLPNPPKEPEKIDYRAMFC